MIGADMLILIFFSFAARQLVPTILMLSWGRAEKEPRISIPVPAVPVSELLAGKNRKICKSLN